ncbi:alpha/beta hydrolase [Alloscardovia venturai]|uniref:Alpha/beta hydrolase n=1 Tax=Alloscardovia venturai TaxID=1769421 RepID=A0ABW2Y5E6_9BIFI
MSQSTYTYATISSQHSTYLDDPEALATAAHCMSRTADTLLNQAHALSVCQTSCHQHAQALHVCATHSTSCAAASSVTQMSNSVGAHATSLTHFSQTMRESADKLTRCLNLYSSAEESTVRFLNSSLGWFTQSAPLKTAFGIAALGVMSEIFSPKASTVDVLTATDKFQEAYMNGLGNKISHGHGVPGSAEILARPAAVLSDILQGNTVTCTPVTPKRRLPAAHGIESSLTNLQAVGEGQLGNSYGTIAIQRYTNASGEHSWVVTIPGTDGKRDSPFGWAQNVTLMAGKEQTRRLSDSQIAVLTAMRQAGIQPGEKVALVGHSQGGIVAASLASDSSVPYTISHVVTAGSPIANHQIDTSKTWVTSVETNKELVSHLDGASNPHKRNWLTVSGNITDNPTPASTATSSSTAVSGGASSTNSPTPVPHASQKHELTHSMNYHVATYRDAEKLHSDDLAQHERHFAQITDGIMDQNMYFECRISHGK